MSGLTLWNTDDEVLFSTMDAANQPVQEGVLYEIVGLNGADTLVLRNTCCSCLNKL